MSGRVNMHKCIFCFNTLKNTDICFETVDEKVELSPDPVKYEYFSYFDPGVSEMDIQCMSRMPIRRYEEGADDIELDHETGIPIAWRQKGIFETRTTRRLCGFCHQLLPHSFGRMPNVTVGLCGNSGSGKTVYMLSMIHDLRKVPNMSVTPDPVFYRGMATPWEQMYDDMYSGRSGYQLPAATSPLEPLSPLVLNCSYTNRRGINTKFSITLFDMAGEGLSDPAYMARKAIYLQNAVGIIYLKNPDYFPGMKYEEIALNEHEHLDELVDAITSRSTGSDRARLAITMTKSDLLLDKYSGDEKFDKLLGKMFEENPLTHHSNGFNVAAALNNNQHMYQLYGWENTLDQDIRALYVKQHEQKTVEQAKLGFFARLFGRRKFEKEREMDEIKPWVMLFAASPLGRGIAIGENNTIGMAPQGMLNVDPMLWLLYCCDIFPAQERAD